MRGDWAPRFECGSVGFQASAVADVAATRSRGLGMCTTQRHLDRGAGSWRCAAFTCRFAEPSSTAPIAAASLVHVAVVVIAVPTLSLARLVEQQRRASEERRSGLGWRYQVSCDALCEANAGDCPTGCCGRARSRHKVKRGTGDDWMM